VRRDHDAKGVGELGDDEREQDPVEHENAALEHSHVRGQSLDNRLDRRN